MIRRALLAISLTLSAPARAQDASVLAEAVFQEGRRLLEAGQLDEACGKFAESLALEVSSGTLLNLALCHEKQGRVATAWSEYGVSARLARAQSRVDRAEVAEAKAAELEGAVPYLTLHPSQELAELEIALDDVTLGSGVLGTPLPIDPGVRRISVRAAGYEPKTIEVELRASEKLAVDLPRLEPTARPLAPPPSLRTLEAERPRDPPPVAVPAASSSSIQRTGGWITVGVGAR